MKIGFGYKMSSGKDTCVNYLIENYGGVKIAFADALYDILYYAQNVCGFPKEKDRKFLQWIGTEWGREKNPQVWIELALRKSKEINEDQNVFCSDVRFLDEFLALKNDGWLLVKVNRDKDDIYNERIGTGDKEHRSENELDSIDDDLWNLIIDNNGTLEELYEKLDEIMEKK